MNTSSAEALARAVADWASAQGGRASLDELRLWLLQESRREVQHGGELLRVAS